MKRRHHRNRRSATLTRWNPLSPNAAQFGDPSIDLEEQLRSRSSKRHQHLGTDDQNLFNQIWPAQFDFCWQRRAIVKRSALEDIGDVALVAAHSHRVDHLVKLLPRSSDEGSTRRIFGFTWGFADEENLGTCTPFSKHGVRMRSRAGAVWALTVVPFAEFCEAVAA